jgi:protein-L-isoaspartate(D-aspartate) O-methyltransferase
VPETVQARLAEFAASLRAVGAIRSDAIEHAFASVERHRCVSQFRYGPDTITVPQDELPGTEVLDLVYSHRSLLTSTGQDGGPPSSSSAPTLMARMLEALDLRPGMRVLELGAGTGDRRHRDLRRSRHPLELRRATGSRTFRLRHRESGNEVST